MEYENIIFVKENNIGTVVMNRPREMNSLNLEIIEELCDVFDRCAEDDGVRAVVLTGSNGVFSAGDDIKIMGMARDKTAEELSGIIENQGYPSLLRKMMELQKPVIAAVNGICFGAAGELALASDYVVASEQAVFGQLYIKLGLIGNTFLLPRHVGIKKAMELIWTGEKVGAEEALKLGMVNQVVPADEFEAKTNAIVSAFAEGPTLAYGCAKKSIYTSLDADIAGALKNMTDSQGYLMKTKDHQEAARAFIEKRKASFRGV